MNTIPFIQIGTLHSEHLQAENTPIQPMYAQECLGKAEIFPEFAEGLADLDGFSHIYLIYHLHRAQPARLKVKPFLQDQEHGIFATRAPCRPNPIGMSLVRLLRCEGNMIFLSGVDVLDGTPILDIKPYSARFDDVRNPRGGWTDEVNDEDAALRGKRNIPNIP